MILSQSVLALVATDVYTVPIASSAKVKLKKAFATVMGAYGAQTFNLSLAVNGAADDPSQYIVYAASLGAGGFQLLLEIDLSPGDVVRAYASSTDVSLTLLGELLIP